MAIASNDRLLVQRSGTLRSIECGNIINLQSGDLLVVQRSSGMGNLRKIDWANKDTDLQDSDMMFVSDVSTAGNTLKKTTWGAVKVFLSATATILASGNGSGSNQNLTLDDLFTPAQLTNNLSKVINIESGAIVGGNTAGGIALDISSTNTVNGTITINNNGTIVGRQGGLSSINGGTAISFSKNATLVNNGTISGGGGKGQSGGQGGTGSYLINLGYGYPIAGGCNTSCTFQYGANSFCQSTGTTTVVCSFIQCRFGQCACPNGVCINPQCVYTSNTYNCQQFMGTTARCLNCQRTSYQTGGAGGAGGFGAGFTSSGTNVSNSSGASGTSPGNNSGAGGQGGAGGDYGLAGGAGLNGSNGNYTNGAAPADSAGSGGASIAKNSNTITVTNNGTINGSITT